MTLSPGDTSRSSPYRGLEPFDEEDAAFFFGRERETRLITASLFASPLTLLYGASGVGKSSVLRAGVVRRLRARSDLVPVVFPQIVRERADGAGSIVLRGWQSDPLTGPRETIVEALNDAAGDDRQLRAAVDAAVARHQTAPLREFLMACREASGRRLMVILDQFEEYPLYHIEDDDFGIQFPRACAPADLSVSFLISLREDSLAKLDRFKGRIPTLWDSYRRVDHLDRAAAEDAIRLPLREYNHQRPGCAPIEIEDQLVDTVLNEVQTGSVEFADTGSGAVASAPGTTGGIETVYLQLVMTRLWEKEQAAGCAKLRWSTLQSEGGAAEIVRTHLDRVMDQFTPEEQDIAARVFHRLVTPSGQKIAFSVGDLADYETMEPQVLRPILRRLEEGNRRILRRVASRSEAPDEPCYEIFHDRLGKAILSWRAKRLQEQERERRQREEAEQKAFAAETRAHHRDLIDAVMRDLEPEEQSRFLRLFSYLAMPDGKPLSLTARDLANLTGQPEVEVERLVRQLTRAGILTAIIDAGRQEAIYSPVDASVAGAVLEWSSRTVQGQAGPAIDGTRGEGDGAILEGAGYGNVRSFPYRTVSRNLARDYYRKYRAVIPFLGSGVALSARLHGIGSESDARSVPPSARDLKWMLAELCNYPTSELEQSDLAEVASFCSQRMGRRALDEFLEETLGADRKFAVSEAHRFLADAAARMPLFLMTTNYDTLMERALNEAGTPYDTVIYLRESREDHVRNQVAVIRHGEVAPEFVDSSDYRSEPNRTVVFRWNGPLIVRREWLQSYALTEEDQIEMVLGLRTTFPPFIERVLQDNILLSLGHSASDWSQRALLRILRTGKRKSLAVALNPTPLSLMTWQRYGVEVYNVDLNEWAMRMREAGGGQPTSA